LQRERETRRIEKETNLDESEQVWKKFEKKE
jgi:hypothetical protein